MTTAVRTILLLMAMSVLLVPGAASAQAPGACTFAGTVKLDGADVAEGTVIAAFVEGDVHTTTTPTGYGASTYSVTIRPPAGRHYPEGSPVSFEVGGCPAQQKGTLAAGQIIRLDLTATTPPATPAPPAHPSPPAKSSAAGTDVWLIAILSVACLVEASLVGGVAYITYSDWNR